MYGITHEELRVAPALCRRIDDWIAWHIELYDRSQEDLEPRNGWFDYDVEGREIALQLRPYLGSGAEVYYYSRYTEEYERIV